MQFEWIVAKSWNTFIVPFEVSLLNSLGKLVIFFFFFVFFFFFFFFFLYFRTVNSKVFSRERLVLLLL